ncbi:MAG: hypothetical protein AAF614_16970 [Chloroflexota bacterium]
MKRMPSWFIWLIVFTVGLAACRSGEEAIVVPTPVQQPTTVIPTVDVDVEDIPTPLPEPTATAIASPTPVPSPTLAPTHTPEPTATAVPATDPELTNVTSNNLPVLQQGVVFIADGALKRWGQGDQGVEILLPGSQDAAERTSQRDAFIGDIVSYAINSAGTRLVAARLTDAVEPFDQRTHQHELLWVDVVSGASRQIALEVEGYLALSVSDDGKYVAYSSLRPGAPNSEVYGVHLLNAEDGGLPQSLGECGVGCGNFVWHPDNTNVVWSDLNAVMIYNISGNEPRVLLENQQGTNPDEIRIYSPIAWARNGRYLLMWEGGYEGGRRAVLDVPTGQVMLVPDSFVYGPVAFAEVTWMQDNRLLVMRPDENNELGSPTIELWRVNEGEGELVLEESSVLSALKGYPVGPVHLEDGRFAFALGNYEDTSMSGFYVLTALGDKLERSNGILPARGYYEFESAWSPTGSGAVVSNQEGQAVYAPADGEALYDVTEAVGLWAHQFTWLPPRTSE